MGLMLRDDRDLNIMRVLQQLWWPTWLLLLSSTSLTLSQRASEYENKHDYFNELWSPGRGAFPRRSGRRLQTRDLNVDEIFMYWQKMYGRWPQEQYEEYMKEYRQRLITAGRSWGLPASDEELLDVYYFLRNRTKVPQAPGWTPERDKCGPTCHLYGTCNQELGFCGCPRGREGPDCSTPLPTTCQQYCQHDGLCWRLIREWCLNECNDRGSCVGGVCHCWPGYFGADCSLSIDYDGSQGAANGPGGTVILAGLNYTENPRGPRIFIYEFPPHMYLWSHMWLDRPMNLLLHERFISLGLRVVDPARADYFFIPGCARSCNNWAGKFKFIQLHYGQYWNRYNGRDHIMTHTSDWGRCERLWDNFADSFIANVTILHQWGLTVDRSKEFEHPLFTGCHKPNQDILVPPSVGDLYTQFEFNIWHPRRLKTPIPKTVLASVAGSICGWNSVEDPPCKNKFYSLGVRAALWQLRSTPGFHIAKRVPSMGQSMAESEFCFAPAGAGYGKRNVIATTMGCMPVIINDHLAQPYEPFLDWNDFGVWIAEADIANTEVILRGLTTRQKAEKMEKLYCAARHLAYTTVYGGLFEGDTGEYDAIATLIHILRARWRNPGVPDHLLIQTDTEFADFMACKQNNAITSSRSGNGTGAPPPAPPLPAAGLVSKHRNTIDDQFFAHRTFTTADWVRSANGPHAGQSGAKQSDDFDPVPIKRNLCMFNSQWVYYADYKAPAPDEETLKKFEREGLCAPKNGNREGGVPPGGSITCPAMGPITHCAVLV